MMGENKVRKAMSMNGLGKVSNVACGHMRLQEEAKDIFSDTSAERCSEVQGKTAYR